MTWEEAKERVLQQLVKNAEFIPYAPHPKQLEFLINLHLAPMVPTRNDNDDEDDFVSRPDLWGRTPSETFYGGSAGGGKILYDDGVVLTSHGWKKGRDLNVGDMVQGVDGHPQKIVALTEPRTLEVWTVKFSDGTETEVAKEHLWAAWTERGVKQVVSTETLKDWLDSGYTPQIPITSPQHFIENSEPGEPEEDAYWAVLGSENESIPEKYLWGSIGTRLSVLQGLMDTNGNLCHDSGECRYSATSDQLSKDVCHLVRSLGGVAGVVSRLSDEEGEAYTISISFPNPNDLFRLTQKTYKSLNRNLIQKTVVDVVIGGVKTGRCLTVSNPDGLYITNDFIVTHNSDAILMASMLYVDDPRWKALILRRIKSDLTGADGLIDRLLEWTAGTKARYYSKKDRCVFPSGAIIEFDGCEREVDKLKFRSLQYNSIGFEESTGFTGTQYLEIISRCRQKKVENVELLPLYVFAASNPGGVGTTFFKERFVHGPLPFVPSTLHDNPSLGEEYEHTLNRLPEHERRQLLHGDWDSLSEGDKFDKGSFRYVKDCPSKGRTVRAWDISATDPKKSMTKNPDWTVGLKMIESGGRYFVEDVIRFQGDPDEVLTRMKEAAIEDGPWCEVVLEEQPGAAGKIVKNMYIKEFEEIGISPAFVGASGNKFERMNPVSIACKDGDMFLKKADWNKVFTDELIKVPNGDKDDQADAFAIAYNQFQTTGFYCKAG